MLDLSYESYLDKKDKGKIKVKKLKNNLSYDAFLGQKTKQQDTLVERTQRIEQGLPVSTNINKSKPNVLGSIVRTPLKLAAEVGTSVVKSAQKLGDVFTGDNSKELEPFSGKYLGNVAGLGKTNFGKSPLDPENLKTIKKSVGVGAELASYLTYGGIAKGALQGTVKKISEEGAKATFKEFVKQKGVSLLKEGALTGVAYTAGSQLQENAETGKDFSWKQALIDISTSTVLTPAAAFGLRKIGDIIPTKKVTPDVPAKVDPAPVQTPTADITKNVTPDVNLPTNIATDIPAPKVTSNVAESVVNKDVETFARDMGENVDDFNEGTFKEWSKGLRNLDIEEVKSVAKGGKKVTPTSIPEGAYLSFMKNIADETGDVKLVQELSNSNVVSKAAQSTVASKLSARGNTTDLLRDIKKSILSRKGTDLDKLTREETKTFNNLKSKIKEITETAPSTKEVKDIISSIFCK